MPTDTVAETLARFITGLTMDEVPLDVEEKARCCLLYGLGIGLCSKKTAFAAVSARAAEALGGGQGASILKSGRKAAIGAALLANAALLHGRCQEDTSGTAHLGVIVIPLLLALHETRGIPAARILPALIAGYEVGGHIEAALARQTVSAGFRASPVYGIFAATAAACKALDVSAAVARSALAHAAAFAGGTLQALGEGTDEWRYQVGIAAEAGLTAVELARAGAEGAALAFEGKQGFARALARVDLPEGFGARLGRDWTIRGVTFKPYPVCAHNQSVVTAALNLRARAEPGRIEALEVLIDPYVVPGMMHKGPFSRVSETLMSTAFCAAAALVRGRLDLAELEAFGDAAILALTARTVITTTPDVAFPGCILRARMRDGSVMEQIEALSTADYDLSRAAILDQLERMGPLNGVVPATFRTLARAIDLLPDTDPKVLVQAFRETVPA